jgi:hypothetical protein
MLKATELALRRIAIVGAAYDGNILKSGKPSMPLVVPRLDRDTSRQVLETITRPPQSEAITRLREDLVDCQADSSVQSQRRSFTLHRQIQDIERELAVVSARDAQAQIANLALMRGLQSIEADGAWVKATTTLVYIQTHPYYTHGRSQRGYGPDGPEQPPFKFVHLGKYCLSVDMASRDFPAGITISRLIAHGQMDYSDTIHPHAKRHQVCWGSFATALAANLRQGRLDLVFSLLLQHIASFNWRDPFCDLSKFAKGGAFDVTKLGG